MAGEDTRFKKGCKGGPGRPKGWTSRSFLIDALNAVDPSDEAGRTHMEVWAADLARETDPEKRINILKFLDGATPPPAKPSDDAEETPKNGITIPPDDPRYAPRKD